MSSPPQTPKNKPIDTTAPELLATPSSVRRNILSPEKTATSPRSDIIDQDSNLALLNAYMIPSSENSSANSPTTIVTRAIREKHVFECHAFSSNERPTIPTSHLVPFQVERPKPKQNKGLVLGIMRTLEATRALLVILADTGEEVEFVALAGSVKGWLEKMEDKDGRMYFFLHET